MYSKQEGGLDHSLTASLTNSQRPAPTGSSTLSRHRQATPQQPRVLYSTDLSSKAGSWCKRASPGDHVFRRASHHGVPETPSRCCQRTAPHTHMSRIPTMAMVSSHGSKTLHEASRGSACAAAVSAPTASPLAAAASSEPLEPMLRDIEAQLAVECMESLRLKARLMLADLRVEAAERDQQAAELRASAAKADAEVLAARLDQAHAEAAGLRVGVEALQEKVSAAGREVELQATKCLREVTRYMDLAMRAERQAIEAKAILLQIRSSCVGLGREQAAAGPENIPSPFEKVQVPIDPTEAAALPHELPCHEDAQSVFAADALMSPRGSQCFNEGGIRRLPLRWPERQGLASRKQLDDACIRRHESSARQLGRVAGGTATSLHARLANGDDCDALYSIARQECAS